MKLISRKRALFLCMIAATYSVGATAHYETEAPIAPTETVTEAPCTTQVPIEYETEAPIAPTETVTEAPTGYETEAPTETVTEAPTGYETEAPIAPTETVTEAPCTTEAPTETVTEAPTGYETEAPTETVTEAPTGYETESPIAPTETVTEAPCTTEAPIAPTETVTEAPCEELPIPTEGASGCSYENAPATCDGSDGFYPISVVGKGVYCTAGPICVAYTEGSCPGPREGLEYGSSCTKIESGVYGCVENTEAPVDCAPVPPTESVTVPTPVPSSTESASVDCIHEDVPAECDEINWFATSVQGVGTFCSRGPNVCSGNVGSGKCPGPQEGLMYGSLCAIVESGVYGCVEATEAILCETPTETATAPPTEAATPCPSEESVTEAATPCPSEESATEAATTPCPSVTEAATSEPTPKSTSYLRTDAPAVTARPLEASVVATTTGAAGESAAVTALVVIGAVGGVLAVAIAAWKVRSRVQAKETMRIDTPMDNYNL